MSLLAILMEEYKVMPQSMYLREELVYWSCRKIQSSIKMRPHIILNYSRVKCAVYPSCHLFQELAPPDTFPLQSQITYLTVRRWVPLCLLRHELVTGQCFELLTPVLFLWVQQGSKEQPRKLQIWVWNHSKFHRKKVQQFIKYQHALYSQIV